MRANIRSIPRRFTLLVLTAAALWGANDAGLTIGTRFSGGRLQPGPKGAVVLLQGSKTQLDELRERYQDSRKLGLLATSVAGPGSGWIVLDSKSSILAKYDPSYTLAAILVHRFGWTPPDATELQSRQLTASIGASNSSVVQGQRIALFIDVDLEPDMHVYAPGVEGYIPIDWKMENSSLAEAHAPEFPKPEKLYLKAIDETVPAYRNRFRLIRDVTITAPASGPVTLDGSLRYQACDDRVCYIPQTLRLHWMFHPRP